jgi:hypothetical protein
MADAAPAGYEGALDVSVFLPVGLGRTRYERGIDAGEQHNALESGERVLEHDNLVHKAKVARLDGSPRVEYDD